MMNGKEISRVRGPLGQIGMSDDAKHEVLTVLAGTFSNQAEAFNRLCAEARAIGIDVSADQTDVIREAREVRLAHYFRPAIVARIEQDRGGDDTVFVLLPSQLSADTRYPPTGSDLRLIGRFAGLVRNPL